MSIKYIVALCISISVITTVTGCGKEKELDEEYRIPMTEIVPIIKETEQHKDKTNNSNKQDSNNSTNSPESTYHKVRCRLLKDNMQGIFDLTIDGIGNGSGTFNMLGLAYPVSIVNKEIFIHIGELTNIKLSGLTWDMKLPKDSNKTNLDSNKDYIVEFKGLEIASSFSKTDTKPNIIKTPVNVSAIVDVTNLLDNISKISKGIADNIDSINELINSNDSNTEKNNITSNKDTSNKVFYVNSNAGIKIRDKIFSVGDIINPIEYFFEEVPEGVTEATEYHNDKPITVTYYSYIEGEGRVEFKTVDGVVYGIHATCLSQFAGFSLGDDSRDLAVKLGYRWNERKDGEYHPPVRNMVTESMIGSNYTGTIDDLNWTIKTSQNTITEFNIYKSLK